MELTRPKLILIIAAGIAAFSLLLLIISVGTAVWLDDGSGNTVGLFRRCYADNIGLYRLDVGPGCINENRVTQGGLSIFGLLLLVGAVAATIAGIFIRKTVVLFIALGLLYFSSMFVMSAYATWGTYSRDPLLFSIQFPLPGNMSHTSMGSSYHLCVAAHYFLWTALTLLAVGVGYRLGEGSESTTS